MTPPSILLCNYTEAEVKAWRFLLRQLPLLRILAVKPSQFGCTLSELLEAPDRTLNGTVSGFSGRMAVFCGAKGELLSSLIDVSRQVTREQAHRATLTETNQQWTLNQLYGELEKEAQQLMGRKK
ncbi:MAG: DUF3783 domain-containing protein [Oscillospiraceae bacterium]|nr:DUF3783 domain-containing protein [Oscillospiraceae bacterium]